MNNQVGALGGVRTETTIGQRLRRAAGGFWSFVRHKPLAAVGLVICSTIMLAGLFAPIVATHDPISQDYTAVVKAPSASHILGTDEFGRDLYSRLVYGARVSLIVAFWAVGIGTTTGFLLGIVSGYYGGWVDLVLQRYVEISVAFPVVLLAMTMVAVLGEAGLDKVVIALSVVFVPGTLRIIRGSVLSVRENIYVEAARAIGAGHRRIMLRHILPNVVAPVLILASVQLGSAILIEATLSYLGLGVPPPAASWGRMLSGGAQMYAFSAPWMVVYPGLAITLLVLGFNLFGDGLRDVLDPKLRGR